MATAWELNGVNLTSFSFCRLVGKADHLGEFSRKCKRNFVTLVSPGLAVKTCGSIAEVGRAGGGVNKRQ